jgi:hypothetical protein
MLSRGDIDRFSEDGFLVVRGLFPAREIQAFRDAVDEGVRARTAGHIKPIEERDPYERMFTQCFNLWEDAVAVRPWTFNPRTAEVASDLLGSVPVRLFCDQSFYKDPGSSETGIHQDYPLMSIEEPLTLNAWIPLEQTSVEGGALAYVRGSHKFGRLSIAGGSVEELPLELPEFQRLPHVFMELNAGDVAFHHVQTYHFSSPNISRAIRKAFAITYFADGCRRGSAHPHASLNRQKIGVGQKIEGPATPIVWPSPPMLPDPPPPLLYPPYGWPGIDRS